MLSIWWALFLYFEKYMYDTDCIFGYTDAKFVSFNHVFYDINNILCLTPINRLLFSSKPGHSFDVYCYSRLLVGVFFCWDCFHELMSLAANLVVTESNILPSDLQWSATATFCLGAVFHFSVSMSLISRIII